jgi:hypothetical protein
MRWLKYLITPVLLSLALAGCTEQEAPFWVVAEGWNASDYRDQQGMVIGSMVEWEELWGQMHHYTIPPPDLPEVDFEQYMLLAVFSGEKQSGGFTSQVERITQTDAALAVHVVETAPGPDQVTISQITYPWQIVRTPRTDLPVRFEF